MKVPSNYDPESTSFEPIPAGEYKVIVEKCSHKQSKSGKMMYSVQLGFQDSKRKLFDNIITDEGFLEAYPKSVTKLISFLSACGAISGAQGEEFNLPSGEVLVAKEIWAQVAISKKEPDKNIIFVYHKDSPDTRASKRSSLKGGARQIQQAASKTVEVKRPLADQDCPF